MPTNGLSYAQRISNFAMLSNEMQQRILTAVDNNWRLAKLAVDFGDWITTKMGNWDLASQYVAQLYGVRLLFGHIRYTIDGAEQLNDKQLYMLLEGVFAYGAIVPLGKLREHVNQHELSERIVRAA